MAARKKSAKKKATKKKPAKKHPRKKPRHHGSGPRPDYVIHIEADGKIRSTDRHQHLEAHTNRPGKPETVAWHNGSDRGRTVGFNVNGWPFVEPPGPIEVLAGKTSRNFTVYSGAVVTEPDGTPREYKYTIEPYPPGGPGDPVVIPDD